MTYSVEITDSALEAIRAEARYIAVDCQSPLNASRWLQRVLRAVEGLERMPRRYGLAAEDAFKPYEVRRVLVGDCLILFTVEDKTRKVWVIGFRHGTRLARPQDLPDELPGDEGASPS